MFAQIALFSVSPSHHISLDLMSACIVFYIFAIMQIHANTCKYMQIHANTCINIFATWQLSITFEGGRVTGGCVWSCRELPPHLDQRATPLRRAASEHPTNGSQRSVCKYQHHHHDVNHQHHHHVVNHQHHHHDANVVIIISAPSSLASTPSLSSRQLPRSWRPHRNRPYHYHQ